MMSQCLYVVACGCWGSDRVSGRETTSGRVDETCWLRHGRDRLLHVSSSLGSTLCRQPVRRSHRQLHSTSVTLLNCLYLLHSTSFTYSQFCIGDRLPRVEAWHRTQQKWGYAYITHPIKIKNTILLTLCYNIVTTVQYIIYVCRFRFKERGVQWQITLPAATEWE